MIEQLDLGQLVKEEERLLGRIGRLQQASDSLDTGPEDLSQRNLTQARTTIRYLRAISYISRIQTRLAPISDKIDKQALVYVEDHQRQLQEKVTDLRVVETARVSPFKQTHIIGFRQEILDFRQRPVQEPLLARGIRLYRQEQIIKGEIVEAAEPLEQIKLTYTDIEARGVQFTGKGRQLMELLLPYTSEQEAVLASDWVSPVWPGIAWSKARIRLSPRVLELRKKLEGTGLAVINAEPLNTGRKGRYYLKVEAPTPKVEIPKFRPRAYKFPKEPFPPTPLRDYLSLKSLQKVMASFTRLDDDTKTLLEQFLASPAASYAILNAIVKFNAHPRGEQETKEFYRFLAGDFLAELGNVQLQPKYQKMGLTLLSPYEKFILFRNAHQEKDIVDPSGYGTSFEIAGVSSADGLVICETDQALEVAEEVECKIVTSRDRSVVQRIIEQHARSTPDELERQLRLTDPEKPIDPLFLGELIHDKLKPNLSPKPLIVSPNMRVVYAIPEGGWLPFENTAIEYVHISSGEAGRFIKVLTTVLK